MNWKIEKEELKLWWSLLWRSVLWGAVAGFVLGFVFGLLNLALGFENPGELGDVQKLIIFISGLLVNLYCFKYVLNKIKTN